MDNIVFAVEDLTADLIPSWMLEDHYNENAPLKRTLQQDMDWTEYLDAQSDGEFFLVTARLGDRLVGYMAVFIHPHLHYRATIVAVDDAHYLMPEFRGQGAGKKMIDFAEQTAKARGATVFSMRCKAAQSHGHIFESLGYKLTDLVYLKDIGRPQE
jgi:GNAT superfamily N-acetyltransferase